MTWHNTNSIASGTTAKSINAKPSDSLRMASGHGKVGAAKNSTTGKWGLIQFTNNLGKVDDSSVAASTVGFKLNF